MFKRNDMISLLELTYRVLNPTMFRVNTDQLPREDEVMNAIITGRARMINEGYKKKDCVALCQEVQLPDLHLVENFTVGGFFIKSSANIFEVKIPALIDNISWENIQFLGSSSFGPKGSVRRLTMNGFMSNNSGGWTSHRPVYTHLPKRLLFKSLAGVGSLFMVAILEDPREVDGFTEEGEFPIPMSMVDRLVISVQREVFKDINPSSDQSQNMVDETLQGATQAKQEQNG